MLVLLLFFSLFNTFLSYTSDQKMFYIGDQDEFELVHNESETIALPQNLVTFVSSQKESSDRGSSDNIAIGGFFYPKKAITFLSILSLANPGNSLADNEEKIKKVQLLLEMNIKTQLKKACIGCLTDDYHFCGLTGVKLCNYEKIMTHTYQTSLKLDILSAACKHVNNILWQELEGQVSIVHLHNERALYKVVGSLYLLTQHNGTEQQLVHSYKRSNGLSRGKLPCEAGKQRGAHKGPFIKINPHLNDTTIQHLIIEPMHQQINTNAKIAEAALSYLKKTLEPNNISIIIVDPKELLLLSKQPKTTCCTVL